MYACLLNRYAHLPLLPSTSIVTSVDVWRYERLVFSVGALVAAGGRRWGSLRLTVFYVLRRTVEGVVMGIGIVGVWRAEVDIRVAWRGRDGDRGATGIVVWFCACKTCNAWGSV